MRRRRLVLWLLVTLVGGALLLLGLLFAQLGWDRADKLASILGAFVGIVGLTKTVYDGLLPRRAPGASQPDGDHAPASAPLTRFGDVPAVATAFQPRSQVQSEIRSARGAGGVTQVLIGGGGCGKSQLAASFVRDAQKRRAVTLTVWVDANSRDSTLSQYAAVARRLGVTTGSDNDITADARAFLGWLAAEEEHWLVVLDDIADFAELEGWWPDSATDTGWVLATTRRNQAAASGGGRTVIQVGVFDEGESVEYLRSRLSGQRTEGLLDGTEARLAAELGYLPLALSHAAAYMIAQKVRCGQYLSRFLVQQARLDTLVPRTADTERYGRQVSASLLLGSAAVRAVDRTGIALAVLRVSSVLDPLGYPVGLWSSPALTRHLRRRRSWRARVRRLGRPIGLQDIHDALVLLDEFALLAYDVIGAERSIQVHALTARAVREATSMRELKGVARACAEALFQAWPRDDARASMELITVLRSSATTLNRNFRDLLWPRKHRYLFYLAGNEMESGAAVRYWQQLTTTAEHYLGPTHRDVLHARHRLGAAYRQAGEIQEAIAELNSTVVAATRVLGRLDLDTLMFTKSYAAALQEGDALPDALELMEQVVEDLAQLHGINSEHTVEARWQLANTYRLAGRTQAATSMFEEALRDSLDIAGPDDHWTLALQMSLGSIYIQRAQTADGIALLEELLTKTRTLFGEDSYNAEQAALDLAFGYRDAGRFVEALPLVKHAVERRERTGRARSPEGLVARILLGQLHSELGDSSALPELTGALADAVGLGVRNETRLAAQQQLAAAHARAGSPDAIPMLEAAMEACAVLGQSSVTFLRSEAELAKAYFAARRVDEAVSLQNHLVAHYEATYGPDNVRTSEARRRHAEWQAE